MNHLRGSVARATISILYLTVISVAMPAPTHAVTQSNCNSIKTEYGLNLSVRANSSAPPELVEDYTNPKWNQTLVDSGAMWVRLSPGEPVNRTVDIFSACRGLGMKILSVIGKENVAGNFTLADWNRAVDEYLISYGNMTDAVEVWNEPDLPTSQKGYMDGSAEHYVELLRIAYEKVKAYNSSIEVVAGACATLRNESQSPGDDYGGWFAQCIRLSGADDYCDAYSYHVYPYWLFGKTNVTIDEAQILANSLFSPKPVWLTEIGYSEQCELMHNRPVVNQSDWIKKALETLKHPLVFWYPFDTLGWKYADYSIVDPYSLEPKPSYYVFQDLARGHEEDSIRCLESCDSAGTQKETFNISETVYIKGTGYAPSTSYAVYVVADVDTWIDGMDIPKRVPDTEASLTTDASGKIPPTSVWKDPLTPGQYDIVIDVNGNGKYEHGIDSLDDSDVVNTAGLLVIPFSPLEAVLAFAACSVALGIFRTRNPKRKRF